MGPRLSKKERQDVQRSYRLGADELESWVRVFQRYGKGIRRSQIDLDGFTRALAATGQSPADLKRIFSAFDKDGNGTISFNEFMFAVLINSRVSAKAKLRFAFDLIDQDGNGFIEEDELMDLVFRVNSAKSMLMIDEGTEVRERLVRRTFQKMDINGDGQISLEEFMEQVEEHGAWILKLLDLR